MKYLLQENPYGSVKWWNKHFLSTLGRILNVAEMTKNKSLEAKMQRRKKMPSNWQGDRNLTGWNIWSDHAAWTETLPSFLVVEVMSIARRPPRDRAQITTRLRCAQDFETLAPPSSPINRVLNLSSQHLHFQNPSQFSPNFSSTFTGVLG